MEPGSWPPWLPLDNNVGPVLTLPAVAPIVTGSRGGNDALAGLLTVVADHGLITDGTTA